MCLVLSKEVSENQGGDLMLKGYYVPSGYMGFVMDGLGIGTGKYILFASESDYAEYMEE